MNVEPVDVDRASLASCIEREWAVGAVSVEFLPVGFGAHHYAARSGDDRWFVTVDDIATKTWLGDDEPSRLAGLECALRAAVTLRRLGLTFVEAPLETASGGVLVRLAGRYVVSLYAWLEGESGAFGVELPAAERIALFRALGSLHTPELVSVDLHSDDGRVPLRAELTEVLDDLRRDWPGPYGDRARHALIAASADLRRALRAFDELIRTASIEPRVVTHGEPHGGNVMRTTAGDLRLIDWDTVALAPRERDLAVVLPRDDDEWAAYCSSGAPAAANEELLGLYRLLWLLTDVSLTVDRLRHTHDDDADSRVLWDGFNDTLGALARGV